MRIDDFDIHPGVIWINEITAKKAAQQITVSMFGQVHVISSRVLKQLMIFEAKDSGKSSRGVFSRDLVEYLIEAEATAQQLLVEYRDKLYNVIVPSGGVQLIPKRETESTDLTDLYVGTITFQEI